MTVEYDIFISYPGIENVPRTFKNDKDEVGWVTEFENKLKIALKVKRSSRGFHIKPNEIFFDANTLDPVKNINEQLCDAIRKTRVFILISCPSYW